MWNFGIFKRGSEEMPLHVELPFIHSQKKLFLLGKTKVSTTLLIRIDNEGKLLKDSSSLQKVHLHNESFIFHDEFFLLNRLQTIAPKKNFLNCLISAFNTRLHQTAASRLTIKQIFRMKTDFLHRTRIK